MSAPTKENIATVMRGFEDFFEHTITKQVFDLHDFMNFMEPKFKEAGYRDKAKQWGGGIYLF